MNGQWSYEDRVLQQQLTRDQPKYHQQHDTTGRWTSLNNDGQWTSLNNDGQWTSLNKDGLWTSLNNDGLWTSLNK